MEGFSEIKQRYDEFIAIGNFKQCEDYLCQILKSNSAVEVKLKLAELRYIYLAKTIVAEDTLKALEKEYPDNNAIKFCLADLYYLIYRDEEALTYYQEIRQKETLLRRHWLQLINILIRNERLEDAMAETNTFTALVENNIEFHEFIVFVRLLLKLNRLPEAINLADRGLTNSLSKDHLALIAEQFSMQGHPDIAMRVMSMAHALPANNQSDMLFKQKALFYKLPELYKSFCQGGQDYYDNTGIKENDTFTPGQLVEVWCVVFGKAHIDMLEKVCLPSLFFNNGFDELLQERKLIFNIYTTKENFNDLGPVLQLLRSRNIGFRINLTLLDSVIEPTLYQGPFAFNALTLLDQIRRSIKYKSIIVSILPDLLMVGGSLKRVIDDMKYKDFVVCRGPRINSDVAVNVMSDYYAKYNKKYDEKEFITQCMTSFIHSQTEVGLNSDNHLLTIKKSKLGYDVHTACPQPLCFYGQQKMIDRMLTNPNTGHRILSSFFCIDNDFIDMAYQAKELVYIRDSDTFFWAELTGTRSHQSYQFFRGWADANSSYYPEGYRYCRKQKVLWRCEV